jgi:protein-tyrosine-phosphatase
MHEHRKRVLFLCAHRSIRSLMAASLFAARAQETWDIWSTPVTGDAQDVDLARQALGELGIPLLISAQTTEPSFGLSWDEGVILCSGLADT